MSSSHQITTTRDHDINLIPNLLNVSNEKTTKIDDKENLKSQPEKYSSSFDSPPLVTHSNNNVVEPVVTNSSSSDKSDFYEPQRFEKEFGDKSHSESEPVKTSDKSVEEIISESTATTTTHDTSFVPIIRDKDENDQNQTRMSLLKKESSSASSLSSKSFVSGVIPLKSTSSENKSTSAEDQTSKSSENTSKMTEKKDTPTDRTDTEIESLPNDDNKYESEFETEDPSGSLVESSILEMSFNESNLNFSYSTVGMVSFLIVFFYKSTQIQK